MGDGGEDVGACEMSGHDIEDLIPGGNCPVQAHGEVDGNPAYFRARGDAWSFAISKPGTDPVDIDGMGDAGALYFRDGDWGAWPDAGWMSEEDASRLIGDCIADFWGYGWPRREGGRVERWVRHLGTLACWMKVRPLRMAVWCWRFCRWAGSPLVRWLARRRGAA